MRIVTNLVKLESICVSSRSSYFDIDQVARLIVDANHSVTSQRGIPVTGAFSSPSAPTSLDRSGLSENHQGGKTGGAHNSDEILNSRVKLWPAKPSNENKMSHAAKNATDSTKQVELRPN
jgi:hypothetical protein